MPRSETIISTYTLPELIEMAREALSFLPQADQDQIFYKTVLELDPALKKN